MLDEVRAETGSEEEAQEELASLMRSLGRK